MEPRLVHKPLCSLHRSHVFATVVLAFSCLVVLGGALHGQTTGSLRGEVSDPQGDPLPGVTITATNDDRGTTRTAVTGTNGRWVLSSMPVGVYTVEASLQGFAPQEVGSVRVGISASIKLDMTLQLETVEETLSVTASPLIDVSSSSVGTSFTVDFIEDLPTDRNFWDMIAVAPGVSAQSEGSTRMSVFGSSTSSNSWNIDGLDTTSSDTGNAWWYINPDTIAEVQVLGIGAPAEYGNMSGGAFNVVTKSGTNQHKGSLSWYHQADSLTTENATIGGRPFNRDEFDDITVTYGGPLQRDKVWLFAAVQRARDAYSEPGVDPNFPTAFPSDRYDLKLNASFNDSNLLEAKYHYEDYDWVYGDAFSTPDATGNQFGTNPAWGIQYQSVLSPETFLEVRYAGYEGDDDLLSRTGSTADPFIDYSPPDGGPTRYSEGYYFPYLFDLSRNQVDVKLSHHADDLLAGDHDFKFGISYGQGDGDTITGGGVNGVYFYRYEYSYEYYGTVYSYPYYYRVTSRPYHYGAETEVVSAFVDDSWQVNSKLTVNVGLRYDRHTSSIPDFPRLNQDWTETGEVIPGLDDAVEWSLLSPRLGFAYQLTETSVLRGFYGKFYDANVTGNWYAPPPDAPSYLYEFSASREGPWTPFFLFEQLGTTVDPDLEAPETDQFTFGYERQLGRDFTLGVQGIYKETENLIGWEILDDGVFEFVDWTNPLTGEVNQLVSILEQPSTRKGNGPGPGSLAPPGTRYNQDYEGLVFTFNKRHSNGWSLQSSYTWSQSEGFSPRALTQDQGSPFYTSSSGRDPNNWLNADQALQNDRGHVLQLQGNFDLPWKLVGTVVFSYLDGKPFSRQVRAGAGSSNSPLAQGAQTVIAIPASSDDRLPSQSPLDLALGRRFDLGRSELKLDVQVLNVFNEDSHDWWQSLIVPAGSQFVPDGYVFPRRVMVRLRLDF